MLSDLAALDLSLLLYLLGCVGLDLLLGDPPGWPHPVRLIGALLHRLENLARASSLCLDLSGLLAVAATVILCAGSACLLSALPFIGALYLGYAGLALGCLLQEVDHTLRLLDTGQLAPARAHLAGLVSRETDNMDAEEIRRALGETLAENFNDAFVAPLFWLSLLGPGALWGYKAVSTMDSMWGYRTERYEQLGKAAALTDDVLAWIPARLSAFFLWVAGLLLARPVSWKQIAVQARTMDSPNAGWPMSAAAHVAQVSMGGPTRYFGHIKVKPRLGPTGAAWSSDKLRLMRRAVLLAAAVAVPSITGLGSWLAWWHL